MSYKKKSNKADLSRILVIPDTHAPAHHPDLIRFLSAIKSFYNPTFVLHLGDEVDHESISVHSKNPDLPSPGDELELAIEALRELKFLFPEMTLLESNHGSRVYRKALASGLSKKVLKGYNELLKVPHTWKWASEFYEKMPSGEMLFGVHGAVKNGLQLARKMGCCVVQGHFHPEFKIEYTSTPKSLLWSLQAGCLIDRKAPNFEYDNVNTNRPIIGAAIIDHGHPVLLPMQMSRGRWTGEIV